MKYLIVILLSLYSYVNYGQITTASNLQGHVSVGGYTNLIAVQSNATNPPAYSFTQTIIEKQFLDNFSIPLGARVAGFICYANRVDYFLSTGGTMTTMDVYIANTSLGGYNSSADVIPLSESRLIFSGNISWDASTSNHYIFFQNSSSNFVWNGVDNIALSIIDTDPTPNESEWWTGSSTVVSSFDGAGSTAWPNYSAYKSLSSLSNITTSSMGFVKARPKISMYYILPNTYTSTGWSDGSVDNNDFLVVNDDLTLCSNATYSGMSVASGVTVTICSTATVTFTGFIKNEGTIFVENGGGLIQTGGWEDNSGSGTWTAKRSFIATDHNRFNYWSSPVVGETMGDVFSGSNGNTNSSDWYEFDVATQDWVSVGSSEVMTAGKGYIATPTLQNPWQGNTISENREFSGTAFNTGTISTNYQNGLDAHILVGNPYAAPLDANQFLTDNSSEIYSTLYYWDDYGAFGNRGYATKTPAGFASAHANGRTPGNYIAAMQGFFVQAKIASAQITFSPDQLESGNGLGQNTNFFKQGLERIWISASNDSTGYNQIMLGTYSGATDGYDDMLDGRIFKANPQMAFYSVAGTEELAIQVLPRDESVETVELGLDALVPGTYTFAIDSMDQWDPSEPVIFEDALTGHQTDLRNGNATVEITIADSYRERFYLHLYGSAMSSSDDEAIVEAVRGFVSESAFVFEAPSAIESIVIMTATGQVVQRADGNGETYAEIGHENLASGVYPAVVSLANGQSAALKLMVP